jgi:chromosome segregation ATPase
LDRNLEYISQDIWNKLTICQLAKIRIKILNKKIIVNPKICYDLNLIETKFSAYKKLLIKNKDALKIVSKEYHEVMRQNINLKDDINNIRDEIVEIKEEVDVNHKESFDSIEKLKEEISILRENGEIKHKETSNSIEKLEMKIKVMEDEISKLKFDLIQKDIEMERRDQEAKEREQLLREEIEHEMERKDREAKEREKSLREEIEKTKEDLRITETHYEQYRKLKP